MKFTFRPPPFLKNGTLLFVFTCLCACTSSVHLKDQARSPASNALVGTEAVSASADAAITAENPSPAITNYSYQGTAETRIRMGDRHFVRSILEGAFGSSASTVSATYIDPQIGYFGGPCDVQNETCVNRTETQGQVIAGSVAAREALRIQACEELTATDSNVRYAVAIAMGFSSTDATTKSTDTTFALTEPDSAGIQGLYDLFFMGETISSDIAAALAGVTAAVDGLSESGINKNFEKWRFLLLTLCEDPTWQIP